MSLLSTLTADGYKVEIPLGPTAAALQTTWSNRPAANAVEPGARIRVSDLGNREFYSNGTLWLPLGAAPFAQSGIASSVTGTIVETTLASITIPGGIMGSNGRLRIWTIWSYTNSANTKTLRQKIGGQSMGAYAVTTSLSTNWLSKIQNRGAPNSQISPSINTVQFSTATSAPVTGSVDTSADQTLTFTGTLTNTSETITLESYSVEVLPA